MGNKQKPEYDEVADASRLLSGISEGESKPLCAITVKQKSQGRIVLGEFESLSRVKGFVIEITPEPSPENAVATRITSLESNEKIKLILHVANYGNKTITASVKQI